MQVLRRTLTPASLLVVALWANAGTAHTASQQPRVRVPPGFIGAVDEFMARLFPQGEPGAVALIAIDDKPVFRRAYGLADLEFSIMLEPDMVFHLGSLSNQFTKAGVLLLAQAGKLSLLDDVRKYVPEYDCRCLLTLEDLLAPHTLVDGLRESSTEGSNVAASYASLAGTLDPPRAVGSTGATAGLARQALLGAVIESVTGQKYADVMKSGLFLPAGLTATGVDDGVKLVPRRVHGYVREGAEYVNAPVLTATGMLAAGAVVSTVDDLMRWETALAAGRPLKRDWSARLVASSEFVSMIEPVRPTDLTETETENRHILEQSGTMPGFTTHVVRIPDDGVFVVVMSNQLTRRAAAAARSLALRAAGAPLLDPTETKLAPQTLASHEGGYRWRDVRVTVSSADDHLRLETGGETIDLLASSGSDFFEPGTPLRLSFATSPTGTVTMTESGWGPPIEWTRVP